MKDLNHSCFDQPHVSPVSGRRRRLKKAPEVAIYMQNDYLKMAIAQNISHKRCNKLYTW